MDDEALEKGCELADEYYRTHSADTESVDPELIVQVLDYINSVFTQPDYAQAAILVFLPGYDEIFHVRALIQEHPTLGQTHKLENFQILRDYHFDVKRDIL